MFTTRPNLILQQRLPLKITLHQGNHAASLSALHHLLPSSCTSSVLSILAAIADYHTILLLLVRYGILQRLRNAVVKQMRELGAVREKIYGYLPEGGFSYFPSANYSKFSIDLDPSEEKGRAQQKRSGRLTLDVEGTSALDGESEGIVGYCSCSGEETDSPTAIYGCTSHSNSYILTVSSTYIASQVQAVQG